ncbi:unnamed protein product [Miscanthus lutarioriparius]|uniref:Uncharacterized protein n=1 Tax=Miscanthus lutarioriparius TaxID=422564 RepID=A0A811PLM6_9POAL|nr:unnamed protein product [Miscanthus lutarioriparius]
METKQRSAETWRASATSVPRPNGNPGVPAIPRPAQPHAIDNAYAVHRSLWWCPAKTTGRQDKDLAGRMARTFWQITDGLGPASLYERGQVFLREYDLQTMALASKRTTAYLYFE